jgi:hypothetical protein
MHTAPYTISNRPEDFNNIFIIKNETAPYLLKLSHHTPLLIPYLTAPHNFNSILIILFILKKTAPSITNRFYAVTNKHIFKLCTNRPFFTFNLIKKIGH